MTARIFHAPWCPAPGHVELLSERRDHLEWFARNLEGRVPHLFRLQGGTGARVRREVLQQFSAVPAGEGRAILATGRYAGEGFDDPRLDTLFLALPISWKGTLIQYAGRLHRPREGKHEVRIYDYVDNRVPELERMFTRRAKGYRSLGYEIRFQGNYLVNPVVRPKKPAKVGPGAPTEHTDAVWVGQPPPRQALFPVQVGTQTGLAKYSYDDTCQAAPPNLVLKQWGTRHPGATSRRECLLGYVLQTTHRQWPPTASPFRVWKCGDPVPRRPAGERQGGRLGGCGRLATRREYRYCRYATTVSTGVF